MSSDRPRYGFDRYSSVRIAYGPSLAPDGKKASFISDVTGVPQAWTLDLSTGQIDQLTLFNERVSAATFSPTGKTLAFSMDPGGGERHQVWNLDMENLATRKLTIGDEWIRVFGSFSPDGESICYSSNERDEKFFDIYTVAIATGEKNLVYQNDTTNYPLDWVDKDRILFTRANTNLDNDLYLLWPETDETAHVTQHSGEASYDYAGHTKDMSTLYVLTNKDREFIQPATIDIGTGHIEFLIEENWDAIGGRISPDNKFLAYFRNVNGASRLHIYNFEKNHDSTIDGLPLGAYESPVVAGHNLMDWSPDSKYLVFSFQGPKHNLNLWLYDLEDRSLRQATFVPRGAIPQSSLVEPEGLRFPSFDDLLIPVWAYRPVNSRGPLPTVVFVHGGPESQETARFNIIIQYLVNRGFLVLAPNVRGSTGYGKKSVHLDDVGKRLDSVRDLEYLAKWAVGKGLAKKDRVGIVGGSYGGFMVLSALTEYPDIWAGGVDLVGIANFETFLENTARWRRHLREAEYGSLEKDRELFKRISPIHHVEKIRAPLMVIHGANDPRVPIGEAEQIVERLKKIGRHVEFLRFEDEGHGIAKIPNRVKAYTAIGDFLERTLLALEKQAPNG
ncbi:MAG TPA: S9 family peptidase [Candidatus Bathyarchaeia archaeon]|nr:S9 family peptidase [Candidatus Bathyarchaeia archaeon]